ncbi:UNVERIFIED_CONTAM: hypothetical protein Sradi_4336100 [Sesamum radiatum]|uniref:Uncharacterized protein n=1 Tax=Sesamum radiatum TaxID=300843 RepID=A0AAW2NPC1_SESRA
MSSLRTAAAVVCVFVFVCLFVAECKAADEGYKSAPTCARLECPPYKLVQTQKEFEIRSYDEGLWLSSPNITAPDYKEGASKGFRMHISTHTLTDQIKKVTLPKFKYTAVKRFDGLITDLSVRAAIVALKESLKGTPYQRAADGLFTIAGYNSPRQLTDRVNEVWLRLTGSKLATPITAPTMAVSTTPPAAMLSRKFLSDGDTPLAASATSGTTIEAVSAAAVSPDTAFSFNDALTSNFPTGGLDSGPWMA